MTVNIVCPHCGNHHVSGTIFCPETGQKLESGTVYCPSCGNKIPNQAKFCPNCGWTLGEITTSAPLSQHKEPEQVNLVEKKLEPSIEPIQPSEYTNDEPIAVNESIPVKIKTSNTLNRQTSGYEKLGWVALALITFAVSVWAGYAWQAGTSEANPVIGPAANPNPLMTESPIPSTETQTPLPIFTASPTSAPTLTSTPAPQIGSTQIRSSDGMIIAYVPSGEFLMGGEGGEDDELPIHKVYLDAYWLDRTEVTNEMFTTFTNSTGYITDAESAGKSWVYTGGKFEEVYGANWQQPNDISSTIAGMEKYPVVHISWNDAIAYCQWAGGRLPTEAEWEKAARGGKEGLTYPWSNETPSCDQGAINGTQYGMCFGGAVPVGTFAQNGYGIYDVIGNVWEWTNDWHDNFYYRNSPVANPQGPETGQFRVLRGGSWFNDTDFLRISSRYGNSPSITSSTYGFRCAQNNIDYK